MIKLLIEVFKWIALCLGLIVLGMIVHEKYGEWRLHHEVPEYVQEVEVAVSNCVFSVQEKLEVGEGNIPESARKLSKESLDKCERVTEITTKACEGLATESDRTTLSDRYNQNIQILEEIRVNLLGE